MPPYTNQENAYTQDIDQTILPPENVEMFNLDIPDDKLKNMLIDDLNQNVEYWNQKPWDLKTIDNENMAFFLGDQWDTQKFVVNDSNVVDNRLFASVRAILSYATGQLAKPEVVPSRSDETYLKMARSIQQALYQHSLDEHVEQKVKATVQNLLLRKRGFMKLRYDPNAGIYGDIVTEIVNPEDITLDRHASFMQNPNKIYHRLRCSVDELCAKFPEKEADIKRAYGIQRAVYSQMSRYITYFECWFTYIDEKKVPREAVCWFIPEHNIILDKIPNPNWMYTGDDQQDKKSNVLFTPPKPFISFNYINTGKSAIDETSLFDQAKPVQRMLNKRLKQVLDNADYVNGRYIASKQAFSEEDGQKLVNKGPRTIGMADAEDVSKAFVNVAGQQLPPYVYNLILDARNEIDTMMGTPAVFRGEQPASQDTLGRDMMVKQQAGALQDDLVRAIQNSMAIYYQIKLQMMRVYYTDDYWFQVKGGDGKFDFVMLNGDNIDENVKIGVQIDSTLPLDKASIRANSLELAKIGKVDDLTLFQDLGLPDPEIRAERLLESQLDPQNYMNSIKQGMDNSDAEIDIMLLIDGKEPQERDDYDEGYLNAYNHFMTTNRFNQLPEEIKAKITAYLMVIQHAAVDALNLRSSMLDQAGMLTPPPPVVPGMPGAPGAAPSPAGMPPAPMGAPAPGTAPPQAPMPTQAPPPGV